ncbi:MAG: GNAT family N-acetyltransferase [Bacteroidota bacterium]
MKIRPYKDSDKEDCLAIFKSDADEFFTKLDGNNYLRWLGRVDMHEQHYYVIEEAGKVVACGGFYINFEQKRAVLAWGMVHRAYHKKGYGQKLLNYRIEKIRELMPEGKIAIVDSTQKNYRFFEKFGFLVTRKKEGFHGNNLDKYEMELQLN